MNKYVYRTLCRNYEQSAVIMVSELRKRNNDMSVDKSEVVKDYEENLRLLRLFLDNEGIVMPRPKWKYNHKDQSTWLYTEEKSVNKFFLMLQARKKFGIV